MPEIEIVLCEPLYEGNIGFTARVMKNFGFNNLTLINPPEIGDDAIARSSHARDVLENARHVSSLDEIIDKSNLLIATTGELSKSVSTAMRMPYYTPSELRDIIKDIDGRVSIIFGRENWGLSNEEISKCDIICTIPTSHVYPIVNISHAVGIVVYELANLPRGIYEYASRIEMDALHEHFNEFLNTIDHPDYKRENTLVMLRRIFGRTMLTTREVSTMHGLLRRAENRIKGITDTVNDEE
ncbi:RNA methyltransferase [Methanoplanus sp. FWC-SCC4]|uniref:RNA methyltransferase n=1 Tax=Methanochimaera problematica TaxID=2609417 RepID=A0AA97FDX8_9EURY|nr:RNA methyltransferase [Methanoplanus sp. FWC-SCC4]WOF15681.1 RNA methyltransferase [Methanoplanus sp. FWC-SCC4]